DGCLTEQLPAAGTDVCRLKDEILPHCGFQAQVVLLNVRRAQPAIKRGTGQRNRRNKPRELVLRRNIKEGSVQRSVVSNSNYEHRRQLCARRRICERRTRVVNTVAAAHNQPAGGQSRVREADAGGDIIWVDTSNDVFAYIRDAGQVESRYYISGLDKSPDGRSNGHTILGTRDVERRIECR